MGWVPQRLNYNKGNHIQTLPSSTPYNNSQRKDDEACLKAPINWSSVCQRVHEWILKGLKSSAIERAQHRLIFQNPGLGESSSLMFIPDFEKDKGLKSSKH